MGITVGVYGGNEDEVEGFEEGGGCEGGFPVGSDQAVGSVIDRGGRYPFPGVDAAYYEDGFSWWQRRIIVCRVGAETEGGDLATFVGEPDVYEASVSGEQGGEETEPGVDYGQGLVVAEEEARFLGRFIGDVEGGGERRRGI